MLGRRGEFEGVADWLPVLPPCTQHFQRFRKINLPEIILRRCKNVGQKADMVCKLTTTYAVTGYVVRGNKESELLLIRRATASV